MFPETDFYCPPRDVIEIERSRERRGHFNLVHYDTGWKADVYLSSDDPLHAWALQNRALWKMKVCKFGLVPPEYVVIKKLEFLREGGSEKHVRDIRGILAGIDVDRAVVEIEIAQRRLGDLWQKCL